jgi:hypothetical protein
MVAAERRRASQGKSKKAKGKTPGVIGAGRRRESETDPPMSILT